HGAAADAGVGVGGGGDEDVAAVGEVHAVVLERAGDDAGGVARQIGQGIVGPEAQARASGQGRGAAARAARAEVGGGADIGVRAGAGVLDGEAQGVVDHAVAGEGGVDLLLGEEHRRDREIGGGAAVAGVAAAVVGGDVGGRVPVVVGEIPDGEAA